MYKLTIDPGHGGEDSGAVGPRGTHESDISLSISKQVAVILSPAVKITMTRTEDISLAPGNEDLYRRCEISNEFGSDAFVSIHENSATDQRAHGVEVYCYPGSSEGRRLAQCIHDRLIAATSLTDRGVKEAKFAVIGPRTDAPAALVETAFISNPTEEELLCEKKFQTKVSKAIADGIADFFGVNLPSYQQVSAAETAHSNASGIIKIKIADKIIEGKDIEDRTWAPVRLLAEAMGHKVEWDDISKTVTII